MNIEVSIVIPCLNEEKTIEQVVRKAKKAIADNKIRGEVVVSDNGSTDNSVALAKKAGARVVHQPLRGYGNAYHKGFAEAKGKYYLMADADDTYDFYDLPKFIKPLREGKDFVIGDRLRGKIMPGAMPWHHKYIGNPVLSGLVRMMFNTDIHDSHCGMRAFTAEAWKKMDLHTTGMEFASEMVIKAAEKKLKIAQFPINLYARPKGSESKLHSFRDGWRHLRFMLMYSPMWLFLVPGMTLLLFGATLLTALFNGPISIGTMQFGVRHMFLGSMLAITGYQIVTLGVYSKFYRVSDKFEDDETTMIALHKYMTLERGLGIGIVLFLTGLSIEFAQFLTWVDSGRVTLGNIHTSILALTLIVIGLQTVFSSFFLSILRIQKRN